MSAVKKTVKTALFLFSAIILLVAGIGAYVYLNMNSLAKNFAERAASEAMGVPVTIGDMDIRLDEKRVVVSDVAVANPRGYKNKHAITIKNITVAGERFSKDLLVFSLIQVDGTAVNLEVSERGANLGELKQSAQKTVRQEEQSSGDAAAPKSEIKVIVREFALTGGQIKPSVTLLANDNLSTVKVKDIVVNDIGEKENGVTSEEAIAQIMSIVLDQFNRTANSAGFLKGMSLEKLNAIGVSTGQVFKKNLKDSYQGEVEKFKKGFDNLKGMFE